MSKIKAIYKPTRQSNAIGLLLMGLGLMAVTTTLYRWQIGPYLRKKRSREAEEWANTIFELEQKAKEENRNAED